MNLEKTPKIVANKNSNQQNVFIKPERTFKTKQELQAYFVDALVKNKRKSFNMNVVLS